MASQLLYKLVIQGFMQSCIKEVSRASNFKKYAETLAEEIKKRTRLGYGSKHVGATKQKLKDLSDKYVEQRQRFKKRGELSANTNPKKSNLTLTGQMLDNIVVDSVSNGKAKITIVGDRKDGGPSNFDVAVFVTDQGRPFLNPTKVELKRVIDLIREDLLNCLRRK